MREAYFKQASVAKARYKMAERMNVAANQNILKEIGGYGMRLLLLNTDDPVLYTYKRKVQREIQWIMLYKQLVPVLSGAFLYAVTRRLKARTGSDFLYAFVPYMYVNWGIFCLEQKKIF